MPDYRRTGREAERQSVWASMLLPCGFLFALLGYIWVEENQYVGYGLLLTGVLVGIYAMLLSMERDRRRRGP